MGSWGAGAGAGLTAESVREFGEVTKLFYTSVAPVVTQRGAFVKSQNCTPDRGGLQRTQCLPGQEVREKTGKAQRRSKDRLKTRSEINKK